MGPIHCGRHGHDNGITTSKGIAARIRQRGQFMSGELVKVSLDRRKYSLKMWMLRAELAEHEVDATYKPTTKEQAFDTSVVAANANWPRGFARCELHGLIRPTRTSPDIEAAILSIDVIRDCHVVRVTNASVEHEATHWFDEAFLRKVLGPDIDIVESTFRIGDRATFVQMWDAGELVCPVCLREVLERSGLRKDDTRT
uniref:hypothetical protein n=1 Tax=Streptomyces rochei TaxID=1928 RepID=UPI0036D9E43B